MLGSLIRLLLLVALFVSHATAQTATDASLATVRPATDASVSAVDVDDDMRKVLRKVGSLPCSERVRSRMFLLLFENNRALHDQCFSDCKYQFFPASQDKATPEQIRAAATSKACITLFSGVILANFPECDIDFVSTRSCAEILLRIKKDIDEKGAVPTQEQFYQFYNLNRVINLLNENATLIEDAFRTTSTRISVWEMTKMMNRIYVSPDVVLAENMTILVREDATTDRLGLAQANVALTLDNRDSTVVVPTTVPPVAPVVTITTVPAVVETETEAPTVAPATTPPAIPNTMKSSRAATLPAASLGVVVMAVAMAGHLLRVY